MRAVSPEEGKTKFPSVQATSVREPGRRIEPKTWGWAPRTTWAPAARHAAANCCWRGSGSAVRARCPSGRSRRRRRRGGGLRGRRRRSSSGRRARCPGSRSRRGSRAGSRPSSRGRRPGSRRPRRAPGGAPRRRSRRRRSASSRRRGRSGAVSSSAPRPKSTEWLFASVSTSKPAKDRIGGSASRRAAEGVLLLGGDAGPRDRVSSSGRDVGLAQRPGHGGPGVGAAVPEDGRADLLAEGDVADRVEDERADDEDAAGGRAGRRRDRQPVPARLRGAEPEAEAAEGAARRPGEHAAAGAQDERLVRGRIARDGRARTGRNPGRQPRVDPEDRRALSISPRARLRCRTRARPPRASPKSSRRCRGEEPTAFASPRAVQGLPLCQLDITHAYRARESRRKEA